MTNSRIERVDIYAIYFDFSRAVMCDWVFYIINTFVMDVKNGSAFIGSKLCEVSQLPTPL